METTSQKREKIQKVMPGIWMLFCIAMIWLTCSFTGHAADIRYLKDGESITAYPLKTGKIAVYEDSGREAQIDKVTGSSLAVAITKAEEGSLYGTYKKGGKPYSGWFEEKAFILNPSYKTVNTIARYKSKAYKRKSGASFGNVPAYARMDVIGKSGNWYQVIYRYKSDYRMGWLKKSVYNKNARVYDGVEKRPMAEGIYTLSPKSNSSKKVTAGESSLELSAGGGKEYQFEFQFTGNGCYKIVHLNTKRCLAAAEEDGEYLDEVVLDEYSGEQLPAHLWKLTRSGGYYYLKNVGTTKYLKAGETFTMAKKGSSAAQKFKITMVGKNKDHWQVFTQYDPEWGGKLYGKTNTMAGAGCGVLSMVNAVYALNGQFLDPMKLAAYAVKHKYRVEHHGTDCRLFKPAAGYFGKDYGFKYAGSTTSLTKLKSHLKSGGTAIAYVPGHYMAVADYKNGKYLALDSYARSKRKTSPFGDWVKGSRFRSGGLKAKSFFLLKAK